MIQATRWFVRIRYWHAGLLWALLLAPLLPWGVPTTRYDDLLFGGEAPWPPERYAASPAAQERQVRQAGADVDLNPLTQRDTLIELTRNEGGRAEILRRFRLFSRQPDEMITFMALQRMRPRVLDFDPRLYQYGGAYIYFIAATFAAAYVLLLPLGLMNVQPGGGLSTFLVNPVVLGGTYGLARLVSLVFAVLLVVTVARLAERLAGKTAGWIGLALAATLPVVVSGALEAKPHLPSAALILYAVLCAWIWLDSPAARSRALVFGAAAGAAAGTVLTGVVAAAMWPVLALSTRRVPRAWHMLVIAAACGALVFTLTNPYLVLNTLFNRAALTSNLSNSTAMYSTENASAGVRRVSELALLAGGAALTPAALLAVFIAAVGRSHDRRRVAVLLAPAVLLLAILASIGAGKPAEYARFLLLPVTAAVVLLARELGAWSGWGRVAGLALAAVLVGISPVWGYVGSFRADARGEQDSRSVAARWLLARMKAEDALAVTQEPAPYATPPVDLATRTIVLLPPAEPASLNTAELPRWLVLTADSASSWRNAWWLTHYQLAFQSPPGPPVSPITWANKPVFVFERSPQPTSADAPP